MNCPHCHQMCGRLYRITEKLLGCADCREGGIIFQCIRFLGENAEIDVDIRIDTLDRVEKMARQTAEKIEHEHYGL